MMLNGSEMMVIMMSIHNEDVDIGQVFLAFVKFSDQQNGQGKLRPVVAFKDPEDDRLYAFKVTSRIDNKINHKYGYLMMDWKEAGLHKPSIIKCNRENVYDIEPMNIMKKLGNITERDLTGLLIKTIKVRQMEYRKNLSNEFER
jgi:hypothetical protein